MTQPEIIPPPPPVWVVEIDTTRDCLTFDFASRRDAEQIVNQLLRWPAGDFFQIRASRGDGEQITWVRPVHVTAIRMFEHG